MIVFPRYFNYRLIIGSLAVTLVALGTYSYFNYNKLEDYKSFIKQEKKLLENELSEMITRYDTIEVDNNEIENQLEQSKVNVEHFLDTIKVLKTDVAVLSLFRLKAAQLKKEKVAVLELVDDLKIQNQKLTESNKIQKLKLEGANNLTSTLQIENQDLEVTNSTLSKKIKTASYLEVEKLTAQAVKRVTKKRVVTTENSNKANKLQVQFTLSKNKFVEEGKKDIYIQILNPNNNVISDQGSINFGKQSLIFSKKIEVDYNNQDVDVSSIITTDIDQPFTKGVYFVTIFNGPKRLGSTSFTLK
jgi:hypothetical protein